MTKKHSISLRVRYEETDQMRVVYYAKYLVWFEVARTEFFRERGLDYREMEDKDKIFLPVVEVYCRYRAPLTYDDIVTITTEIKDIGAARISFQYEVKKDDKVIATGSTTHAFVNEQGSPIPVPEKARRFLSDFKKQDAA
ncbi:MAG: thioesterase family protein [Candidatus Omnitrophota bacterium]